MPIAAVKYTPAGRLGRGGVGAPGCSTHQMLPNSLQSYEQPTIDRYLTKALGVKPEMIEKDASTNAIRNGPNSDPRANRHDLLAKADGLLDVAAEQEPEPRGMIRHALLAKARRTFGDALSEIILTGQREVSPFGLEQAAKRYGDHGATRLRNALAIADQLLEAEAQSTVQAWFVGKNPILGDRAPALVIGHDLAAVKLAARHFLAYG